MILRKSQITLPSGDFSGLTQHRQDGIPGTVGIQANPWPRGVVPVFFEANITQAQKASFQRACSDWGTKAGIRCPEISALPTNDQPFLVVSTEDPNGDGMACAAGLGAWPYQIMQLPGSEADRGCWTQRVILHELGHVLGFQHEHQRADRDQYISILLDNVHDAYQSQFSVTTRTGNLTAYDFKSIMHYGARYFSKNGNPTIVAKPGYEQYQDYLGSVSLSAGDAEGAYSVYGPPRDPSCNPDGHRQHVGFKAFTKNTGGTCPANLTGGMMSYNDNVSAAEAFAPPAALNCCGGVAYRHYSTAWDKVSASTCKNSKMFWWKCGVADDEWSGSHHETTYESVIRFR